MFVSTPKRREINTPKLGNNNNNKVVNDNKRLLLLLLPLLPDRKGPLLPVRQTEVSRMRRDSTRVGDRSS